MDHRPATAQGAAETRRKVGDPEVPDQFTRACRPFKKAFILTRSPSAPRRAFPQARPNEVRDAKNNEAHCAMKKERHVCERPRDGKRAVSRERQCLDETAVSRENAAG
jgi:hypothetical protein